MPAFLRFVTLRRHDDSHVAQGVFAAAYELRDAGALHEHERVWFEDVVGWFETHMKTPNAYGMSNAARGRDRRRAVFWVKGTTHEHVRRIRELAAMLAHHGVSTREVRARRPGLVVYEDEHQVGAIPFRDTKT